MKDVMETEYLLPWRLSHLVPQKLRSVVERLSQVRVFGSQSRFSYDFRALIDACGFVVLTLLVEKRGAVDAAELSTVARVYLQLLV